MLEGQACVFDDDRQWELTPDHMYWIPADHTFHYEGGEFFRKLYFHIQVYRVPGIDLFYSHNRVVEMEITREFKEKLMKILECSSIAAVIGTRALLLEAIADFLNEYGDPEDFGYYRQKEVFDYLEKNISASLKIKNMAHDLQLSYFSLSRNFHQDTGMKVKEYMDVLLMNKARKLLLVTDWQVQEISEELGFSDPYYFSKFFSRHEGISPLRYRKNKMR